MRRASLFIIFSVLLLVDRTQAIFGWRDGSSYKSPAQSQSSKSLYNGDNGNYPSRDKFSNSGEPKSQARNGRTFGVSAWGIIGIIVGAISLTTIIYYAIVLYPYLCKKQRSYDMIELTDVV